METEVTKKIYLGDSVYASFDGFQICLTTENGMGPSNIIFLEQAVLNQLLAFIEKTFNITISIEQKERNNG